MKNIIKIILLGIIVFAIVVYVTADKPVLKEEVAINSSSLKVENLPQEFQLVGKDTKIPKNELFKEKTKTLIIVGNHDSLAVVKDLPKFYKMNIEYVMVANIASAPWFVKKMFIPSKLEELNAGTNIPMIYDFEGNMINALGVTDNSKTLYIAYLVNEDESIVEVARGSVKDGALDGTMNDEEKKQALAVLKSYIK